MYSLLLRGSLLKKNSSPSSVETCFSFLLFGEPFVGFFFLSAPSPKEKLEKKKKGGPPSEGDLVAQRPLRSKISFGSLRAPKRMPKAPDVASFLFSVVVSFFFFLAFSLEL